MATKHKDLTDDNELHNPKGFESATANQGLIKNDIGDLEWVDVSELGGSEGPPGSLQSISVADIDDPATELNAANLATYGRFIYTVEAATSQNDIITFYRYDSSNTEVENSPYILDTLDGGNTRWVAVGGKYSTTTSLYLDGSRTISSAEITKLAGVESNATADQTGAEIKSAYEAEADTNAYTDSEKTQVANTETSSQLDTRDTNNRNRSNHTGTQTASTISDFDTEVSNNTDVAANTAKVSNATHTGDVTGSTALTVSSTAISGKTLKSSPSGTEEVLINDAGTLKKTTAQDIADLGSAGTYLDRSFAEEDRFFVNSTNDFTTESSAIAIDFVKTPNATGNYLITISYGWSVDTGTFDIDCEMLVDDGGAGTATTVRRKHLQEPQDAAGADPDDGAGSGINGSSGTDQRHTAILQYMHSATASTDFNVILRHRATDAGIESTIKWSLITVERFN